MSLADNLYTLLLGKLRLGYAKPRLIIKCLTNVANIMAEK